MRLQPRCPHAPRLTPTFERGVGTYPKGCKEALAANDEKIVLDNIKKLVTSGDSLEKTGSRVVKQGDQEVTQILFELVVLAIGNSGKIISTGKKSDDLLLHDDPSIAQLKVEMAIDPLNPDSPELNITGPFNEITGEYDGLNRLPHRGYQNITETRLTIEAARPN